MKSLSKHVALGFCCFAYASVCASESQSVGVTGRIAPNNTQCTPVLSSNVLDYGTSSAIDLNTDTQTSLGRQTFTLTVDCNTKIKRLLLRFIDHKADDAIRDTTAVHHPLCPSSHCAGAAFGLGRDGQGQKVGALYLIDKGATIDGEPVNWWSTELTDPSEMARFWHDLFSPYRDSIDGHDVYNTYSPASLTCDEANGGNNKQCFSGRHFIMPIEVEPIIDSKDRKLTNDMQINSALTIEMQAL